MGICMHVKPTGELYIVKHRKKNNVAVCNNCFEEFSLKTFKKVTKENRKDVINQLRTLGVTASELLTIEQLQEAYNEHINYDRQMRELRKRK